MNSTILTKIRRGGSWERPSFDQPMPTDPATLKELGVDRRGRTWYSSRLGELATRPGLIDDSRQVLPDGPILRIGDLWQGFDVFAPSSYRALADQPVRKPKAPPPHRVVDALALTHLGSQRPERIVAFDRPGGLLAPASKLGVAPIIKPAEPPARGAEAVIARLRRAGSGIYLSTDGQHVILTSSGGTPAPGVSELFAAAYPLILAHLRGGPLLCVVANHGKGQDPTATTLLVGGCPSCDVHANEMFVATGARGVA